MCMLIITHACNLDCSYCYESHKSNKRMDVAMAKEIILSEIELVRTSDAYRKLEVHFIGGEPFMNFPLIKEVVEWLEDLKPDIPIICSCSSNGT